MAIIGALNISMAHISKVKVGFIKPMNETILSFYTPPTHGEDLDPAVNFTSAASHGPGFEAELISML